MAVQSFFEESREQSIVKTMIVSKYFWAWAKVIIPTVRLRDRRIAYLDLFAGPGRYGDGNKSTPLLILEKAIDDPDLAQMLVTVFNDRDERQSRDLENAIRNLPGIGKLKYAPKVHNEDVGSEMVKEFESVKLVPTLFFVDPWGYKGLSLQLVNSVLKNWGCDCIFFFNYNRINPGLSNPAVEEHMNALFGKRRADELRNRLAGLSPEDRELLIVEELSGALAGEEGRYVLPFRFLSDRGTRTTHHLIFVSKAFKGYEIMKEIMAKESSAHNQGVPSFEYSPSDRRFPLLFELTAPLNGLEEMLLQEFMGLTICMEDLYLKHSVGRSFIKRNYKDALLSLEEKSAIHCDPPISKRRRNTMGPGVKLTFPGGRPKHVA